MEIKLGTASICMVSHEGRFNALSFYNWNNDRKALFFAAENSGEAMWKFPSRVLKVFVLWWTQPGFPESRRRVGPCARWPSLSSSRAHAGKASQPWEQALPTQLW